MSPNPVAPDANAFALSIRLRLSCTELQFVDDRRVLMRLPVISMGSEAVRVLRDSHDGCVLASFERSFYVQCDHGIVCVGAASLGEGPLHIVLVSGFEQLSARVTVGLSVSMPGDIPQHRVTELPGMTLNHDDKGAFYTGRVTGTSITPTGLNNIQQVFSLVVSPQRLGFGWIVANTYWADCGEVPESAIVEPSNVNSSLRKQCAPALLALSQWLHTCLSQSREQCPTTHASHSEISAGDSVQSRALKIDAPLHVSEFLGAGPGLTPAGDDLLAGVMLALYRINRGNEAVLLWTSLEPLLASRTNAISGAHLRLAAQGQCSAPVLELLGIVFSAKTAAHVNCAKNKAVEIQSCANRIGASSGWDMLAGIGLVLRAL